MNLSTLLALTLSFVMPSSSILRRVAGARDDLTVSALRAEAIVTIAPVLAQTLAPAMGLAWTSGELTLNATISVRFPGRCRVDVTTPEANKAMAASWSNGKRSIEGAQIVSLQVLVDQLCATLALRSGSEGESKELLERHLKSLRVETRRVSFGRFGGTVAYVLGQRDDTSSQFWVVKDRYLPARIRFSDGADMWDVRFVDFGSHAAQDWLPRMVEVYRQNEFQMRLSMVSADARADLSKVKF